LVRQYDSRLATLKTQINANKQTLESDLSFLKGKEKEINQDIASRDQAAYEADVREYNSTVNSYNNLLASTRKLIDEYNGIIGERNEIAVQEQELQKALDSRLTSPPSRQ
jgi:predicted phage-related endonuclease